MTLWTQTSISHSSMCAVASPKICKHRKASWIELKASLFWVVILISTCSSFKTIVRLQGCRRCYAIRVWKLCYSVHTEEILAKWLVVVIVMAPLSLCYKRSGKKMFLRNFDINPSFSFSKPLWKKWGSCCVCHHVTQGVVPMIGKGQGDPINHIHTGITVRENTWIL